MPIPDDSLNVLQILTGLKHICFVQVEREMADYLVCLQNCQFLACEDLLRHPVYECSNINDHNFLDSRFIPP